MSYFQNVKSKYAACVTLVVDYCPLHHITKAKQETSDFVDSTEQQSL